jgi:hypothetical protein
LENGNNDELNKKVDDSWKEAVDKEKASAGAGPEQSGNGGPEAQEIPDATFGLFIYGLMMEAMIALGEAEHPLTKKKELNAVHARFIIDTLAMLQGKTKGNLAKDETDMLEGMLYDLRMRFVRRTTPPKP